MTTRDASTAPTGATLKMGTDHRIRRRLGVATMLASLTVAATGLIGGPALAAEDERQPAEVTEEAFWYAPRGEILPDTLVSEFPPGVVCVVRPELCPDGLEPVFDPVEGAEQGLIEAEEENQQTQPGPGATNPETLPVSATGGKPDYRSAFVIELPEVPEGKQVDEFQLILTLGDPTYAQSSPMFRQTILAAFTCVRGCQEDQFEKIPSTDAQEGGLLDVEICPIAADAEWEAERGQPAASIPEADCLYGANAQYDEDGTEAVFDLTFAMQAFDEGTAGFNGFLIRPANLPNLAYGDPDVTNNKMLSFEKTVHYTIATSDEPEPVSFDFGGDGGGFDASGGGTDGASAGFSAPSAGSSGGDIFSAPATTDPEPGPAAPEPDVAEAAPGDEQAAAPTDDAQVLAGAQGGEPSAWYVWLLVPVFGAGMFLTAQSLTAPAIVAESAGREGAMSRLIRQRQALGEVGPELANP
jgi:hypothetical protein